MARSLAVDKDGNLSYCSVPPEMRGMRGCPHVAHQESGETVEEFIVKEETGPRKHLIYPNKERISEESLKKMTEAFDNKLLTIDIEDNGYLDAESVEVYREELREDYKIEDSATQDKVIKTIVFSLEDTSHYTIERGDKFRDKSAIKADKFMPHFGISRYLPELHSEERALLYKDLESFNKYTFCDGDTVVGPKDLGTARKIRESESATYDIDEALSRQDDYRMYE